MEMFSVCAVAGRFRFPLEFQHGVVKSNMENWVCVLKCGHKAPHTHAAAVADSSTTERPLFCWLFFLFLSAGLLPLLRLPWEPDPGPTPPLRPSSSRRWWPRLMVTISFSPYIYSCLWAWDWAFVMMKTQETHAFWECWCSFTLLSDHSLHRFVWMNTHRDDIKHITEAWPHPLMFPCIVSLLGLNENTWKVTHYTFT